jgi:GDPmannose 4,6-dehydratase
MWLMLQQDTPDDFVISTGKTYSVREFLELVFKEANLDIEKHVEIDSRLFRPHEVPLLLGDSSKAKQKLGWVPDHDIHTLVKDMYRSDLRSQEKILRSNYGNTPPEAWSK